MASIPNATSPQRRSYEETLETPRNQLTARVGSGARKRLRFDHDTPSSSTRTLGTRKFAPPAEKSLQELYGFNEVCMLEGFTVDEWTIMIEGVKQIETLLQSYEVRKKELVDNLRRKISLTLQNEELTFEEKATEISLLTY